VASLIFKGDVILKNGVLHEQESEQQIGKSEENKTQEGRDSKIMALRALYAYEYIHRDSSHTAIQLRGRLDNALNQNTSPLYQESVCWESDMIDAYFHHYRNKNLVLLTEPSFVKAYEQRAVQYEKLQEISEQASFAPCRYAL
jgi:glutathionylspermidine synthase